MDLLRIGSSIYSTQLLGFFFYSLQFAIQFVSMFESFFLIHFVSALSVSVLLVWLFYINWIGVYTRNMQQR